MGGSNWCDIVDCFNRQVTNSAKYKDVSKWDTILTEDKNVTAFSNYISKS